MPVKMSWPIVIGVLHPHIGGWAGAYFTTKSVKTWYETLNKPCWTPPNWMFAPVWTSLYCTMGYSSYLVWRDGGGFEKAALPLSIYGTNLLLNWAWTPIYFGLHNVQWVFQKIALYEIVLLWGSTAVLGVSFYQVNKLAGCLIIPYFAWTSLATALNYVIYRDNKPKVKAVTDEKTK